MGSFEYFRVREVLLVGFGLIKSVKLVRVFVILGQQGEIGLLFESY